MSSSKILLQINASIATYKICELISLLVKAGHEVQVVASKNALRFVGAATLEGLSGHAVYSDLWEEGRMMDHIHLNRWADLLLVAPATANYLNRAAAGMGDDLLGTLFLAHDFKKPFLVAPAMNASMLAHPATQASIKKLQQMGLEFLDADAGDLACGETGPGRLMEPEQIFERVQQTLSRTKQTRKKILVTSGGTSEKLDDVRVLTNKSSGATGAAIADQLLADGFEVTYVGAKNSILPKFQCEKLNFESFEELETLLKSELKNEYAAVIHTAAVSDFSPTFTPGKISSEQENLQVQFKRNPKLVIQLKHWSANKNLKLVAFKLTSTLDSQEQVRSVKKLESSSSADLVIQNDFNQFQNNEAQHEYIGLHSDKTLFKSVGRESLARNISNFLKENEL